MKEKLDMTLDGQYTNLNKKTDKLKTKQNTQMSANVTTYNFHPRTINLTQTNFTEEKMQIIEKGPNYAIEQLINKHINQLLAEMENAISYLDTNIQQTYRQRALKKTKQILNTKRKNNLHKRRHYVLKQIGEKVQKNNLNISQVEKGKILIIVDKE
jgi:biotin-(acetyl-CoA carboxylase) ligase